MEANENKFLESIKNYSDFISVSFKDLVKLTIDDKKVFLDLYYNRTSEFNEMQSVLKNIKNRGDNILILGYAGTGKSSFMYKVFYEIENMPEYNLYPIIVDHIEGNKDFLYEHFIDKMNIYFNEIENPANGQIKNIKSNFTDNLNDLKSHLSKLNDSDFKKHLVILLDDFDYLKDEDLIEVLETFQGFGAHKHVTLILSARPALYTAIREYDNRLEKTFTREVHKIELARLDIHKLVARRLAALIIENKTKTWWERLMQPSSAYIKLLQKMGISDINNLNQISIPFTGLYLNFIRNVSNNNIREIFDIVHDSLIFVLENYNKLKVIEEKNEDGEIELKKNISIEDTLKLFYDEKSSLFKIINLHKTKSKKGNSLLFNLLEGIKHYQSVNMTFREKMKILGHSDKDIDYGIKRLKQKNNALIIPKKIIPSCFTERVDRYPEYRITNKGNYYLTVIVYWEEYISRCGHFGKSLHEII